MSHICNSSTWEIEREGSGVQGHPGSLSELEACLSYMKSFLKFKNKTKNNNNKNATANKIRAGEMTQRLSTGGCYSREPRFKSQQPDQMAAHNHNHLNPSPR